MIYFPQRGEYSGMRRFFGRERQLEKLEALLDRGLLASTRDRGLHRSAFRRLHEKGVMKNTDWLRRAAVVALAAACSAPSYGRDVGLGDWRLAKGAVREGDLLTIDSSVGGPNCNAFAEVDLSPCADVGYEVHVYDPGEFTHQGVQNPRRWARSSYPDAKRGWDKDYLRRVMEPVLAFQRRHGARIYVGEFSAIAWADGADRYIADCISLFNEHGFDWTYHAFREWPGWSVEHECEAPGGRFRPSSDNPRLRVLKAGLLGPSPETPAAPGAESAR